MQGFLDPAKIAELLGVDVKTVHKYRSRGDMPEPDEHVGRTPVWTAETIHAWLNDRPGHGWRKGKTSG